MGTSQGHPATGLQGPSLCMGHTHPSRSRAPCVASTARREVVARETGRGADAGRGRRRRVHVKKNLNFQKGAL